MNYIDTYCNRRSGEESVEYLHSDLEPILKNTYGVIVFQEQLIEIGRMSKIHNPDLLRKATGKKDPELLKQVKPEIEEKILGRGWLQSQFDKLWSDMLEFSKYSFNKSHSTAYGIIAYMTAKQKAYYPAEFYAGLCNSYLGKSVFVKDNADEIVSDMMRHNIRIAPFNFRNDHRRCHVVNKQVVYAVPLIRDCNEAAANAMYKAKDKEYQRFWELLDDLYKDGVSKNQMNILILLGFFNEFGAVKNQLRMNDIYLYFKDRPSGEMKTMSKDRLPESGITRQAILKYSTDKNEKGKELKTYRITSLDLILNMCNDEVMSVETSDFDFKNKIVTQRQYLGFVMLTTGKENDRKKLYVKNLLPAYRKRDGEQFGYYAVAQSIGSGKTSMYTVMNRKFNKCPFEVDDVIFCDKYSEDMNKSEKDLIISALEKHKFNKTAVARELGISRMTLYRKLEDLDL
jgi:DNA polymerase-3 subunit alpha